MEDKWKSRLRKPEGVYVMCLLMLANFGVYQFYYDFLSMKQNEQKTPLMIAIVLIGMDVFSGASAIWAFFGDNLGRISLLIFISLNMLWSIFILILRVSYAVPKENGYYDSDIFLYGLTLIKPLISFGLCWWYFTRSYVIAYYNQENNNEFF